MEIPVLQWLVPWSPRDAGNRKSSPASVDDAVCTKYSAPKTDVESMDEYVGKNPVDVSDGIGHHNSSRPSYFESRVPQSSTPAPPAIRLRRRRRDDSRQPSSSPFALLLTTLVVVCLSLPVPAAAGPRPGPAPAPVSAADLSPVDMMRKFQGWIFASSSTSSTSSSSSSHSPSSVSVSAPAGDQEASSSSVSNAGKPGQRLEDHLSPAQIRAPESQHRGLSSWSHSKGAGDDYYEAAPPAHETEKALVSDQERRLGEVQNNPGAWGISDFQDEQFLTQYLRQAKENFGDRLDDEGGDDGGQREQQLRLPPPASERVRDVQQEQQPQPQQRRRHQQQVVDGDDDRRHLPLLLPPTGGGGRSRIDVRLEAAAAERRHDGGGSSPGEEDLIDHSSPLVGFIRVPHLPHEWYTAETHEPMAKADGTDDESKNKETETGSKEGSQAPEEDGKDRHRERQEPETGEERRLNDEEDPEVHHSGGERREPFVFYSDWTRPNQTIEKHLRGSLSDLILDVEAENDDLPYQEPNIGCLAAGSNFCSIQQDFPKAIMGWIDEKFADILSNFSLPNTPEAEAGGPLFAASRDYISPDDAPCESERSDLQPSWVRDEKTGSWVLVVQTMSLQQWIRLEECISKDVSCQYVMPYYGSVCREKSTLHQLVAWNPSAPEMLSFAYFKAPNGCECHILNSFHHRRR